jgi:hypothetical protein
VLGCCAAVGEKHTVEESSHHRSVAPVQNWRCVLVIVDETWFCHLEPISKQELVEWHHMLLPRERYSGVCHELGKRWLQFFGNGNVLFL